ncbi:MAG: hypothetical protein FJX23_07215 [Alphaproteobacteria bacterium]|nr:hypothetical protein [Alphaproteobacteria bacterium]
MTAESALERIRTALIEAKLEKTVSDKGKSLALTFTGKAGGEWLLQVQQCGWDIFGVEGDLLAHEESGKEEKAEATAELEGNTLETFEYETETGDVSLSFDDGTMLALYTPDKETQKAAYFSVFTPDGHALSFKADKTLEYGEAKGKR